VFYRFTELKYINFHTQVPGRPFHTLSQILPGHNSSKNIVLKHMYNHLKNNILMKKWYE